MTMEKRSPCKVNLLLNILGKRADGFHELETVMHPVNLCDLISFDRGGTGVVLTCNRRDLPTDASNLVHRAATAFLQTAGIQEGVRLHLTKRIPLAAGLGGGSGNAATTLLGLNELFGFPVAAAQLSEVAATLGSDVPFFLQAKPALATGRGERIEPLEDFPALHGMAFLLLHPGFGIATAWAYQQLAAFPAALQGRPGRARRLVSLLQTGDVKAAATEFYNSLESPALHKYPVLALYQDFFREQGAVATLMSGSGSTTFAVFPTPATAHQTAHFAQARFGSVWTAVVPI